MRPHLAASRLFCDAIMSAAASTTKCHVCGSDEIDYDPARGDAACVDCGTVVQQSLIVNEVAFQEDARGRSNLVGQHVRADGQGNFSALAGHSRQATENTMSNARFRILPLASQLRLSSRFTDQALRLFRLAVERNFHKGRRVTNLCCACLYTVCRLGRTPHMLIDFADVSQTNLYVLGNTYLKLTRLLNIQLPVIDPSLYMHRFAAKLEYGEKANDVAMTALRITARMQRDWMTHGRRPAGLCGAALITASMMHNFYRSQREVARVVRIGNVVLRNRLRELDRTATATLTAMQIDAGGGDDGKCTSLRAETLAGDACDPPAFERAFLQSQKQTPAIEQGETAHRNVSPDTEINATVNGTSADVEIARASVNDTSLQNTNASNDESARGMNKKLAETERAKKAVESEQVEEMMRQALASDEMQALDIESQIDHRLTEQGASLAAQTNHDEDPQSGSGDVHAERTEKDSEDGWVPGQEEVELSDLDEEDTAKYISTEDEFKAKEIVWTETNKDYIEKQQRLEQMKRERPEDYKRLKSGRGQKKRRTSEIAGSGKQRSKDGAVGSGDEEDLVPKAKPSKKLNYAVLQSLEEETENIETGGIENEEDL